MYAIIIASALSAIVAHAQVIYTDVKPDEKFSCSKVGCSHQYNLDLDNDGSNDFTIGVYKSSDFSLCGKSFSSGVSVSGVDFNQTSGYPLLSLNTIINDPGIYSASANLGWANKGWIRSCFKGCSCSEINSSSPSSDGYLGLGLVKGAHTYYGWVRLSVSVSYNSVGFTIKDYAYNSIPNQPILAGQTSTVITQVQKNGVANPISKNAVEQKNIIRDFINTLSSYPNPFSNSTTISFSISESQKVSLKIYDMTGRLVKTLANAEMQVGTHQLSWNAKDEKGNAVSAGIYLLRFDAGTKSETKKLSVIN